MKKLWKETILLTVSLSLLAACNGNSPFNRQSDPLAESYSSLRDDVPEEQLQPEQREQQAIVKPFVVSTSSGNNTLTFYAGEEGRHEISARVYLENITSKALRLKNAPKNLKLVEKDLTTGTWEIVWTPSNETVTIDKDEFESEVELEVEMTSDKDSVQSQIDALEKRKTFKVLVRKSKEDPFVVESKELDAIKDAVSQDQSISFSVDVEDPGTYGDWIPRVLFDFDSSTSTSERKVFEARAAIIADISKKTKKIGENRWRTYWSIDIPYLATLYKDQKDRNDQVTVGFQILVISKNTRREGSINKEIKINIEDQPQASTTGDTQ